MRILQVGVGKMGRTWLRVLPTVPEVEFVGIIEPVDANREWAMNQLGFSADRCFASVDAALAWDGWDGAAVVTPPVTHRPIAEQILRGGRHVLLEKPLAATIDDAEALVRIAAETGKVLMVAQNYRYRPEIRGVVAAVRSGQLGEIRSVQTRFSWDARTIFGDGDFRYTMEQPLLIDMSIHHFDMLRAITGQDVASVFARTWHVPSGAFEHHAAASLVMTLGNGATATYQGNWDGFDTNTTWDAEWDIVGDLGRIRWQTVDGANVVELLPFDGEARRLGIDDGAPREQAGLLADFARAVETGEQPATNAADNIRSFAIGIAAVRSADTGDAVSLG